MLEAVKHQEPAVPASYDEESRYGRAVLVRHQRAPLMVALFAGAERPLVDVFRAKRPRTVVCSTVNAGGLGGCDLSFHRGL